MANRIKTVEYAWPPRTTIITNNTLTSLGTIQVKTWEGGELNPRTFLSAIVRVSFIDAITATGGTITTKTLRLSFNFAPSTAEIINPTTIANSGENVGGEIVQDFTNYFNTEWEGGTRSVTLSALFNQTTGTTLGMINVCATLELTYAYDDTPVELSPGIYSRELKTVRIPLNAPPGPMVTGATTYYTLPALDTYLPEEDKQYLNAFVVIQGNQNMGNATTDHTLTLRLGTFTHTTGNFEKALASDIFYRYIWSLTADIATLATASRTWQPTSSLGTRNHHFQAYLVVTYEYDEVNSTQIMNSVMLPMKIDSPFGGTTINDSQSSTRDFWIQEQDIGTRDCAFFVFWTQIVSMSTLHMRAYANNQPSSFVGYTDSASVVCGSNAAMIRNNSISLARGLNKLTFEAYRTQSNNYGWNVSGFWIINYVSSKQPGGAGSHNKTILFNISQNGTDGLLAEKVIPAVGLEIPEPNYYINGIGTRLIAFTSGTTALSGFTVQIEKLQNEDPDNSVRSWENCYRDIQQSDPEIGVFCTFSQIRDLFKRYPEDIDLSRMDLATPRRWRIYGPQASANTGMALYSLSLMLTYHSINYPVNGDIVGSFPGSKTARLYRDNPPSVVKQQTILATSDSFSFQWYDNTSPVFVRLTNGDGTFHYSQVRLASPSNDFSIQRVAPYVPPSDGETLVVTFSTWLEYYGPAAVINIPQVPSGHSIIVAFHMETVKQTTVSDNGSSNGTYTLDHVAEGAFSNDIRFYSRSNITDGPTQVTISVPDEALFAYKLIIVDGPIICHADTSAFRQQINAVTEFALSVTTPVDNCLVFVDFNTTVNTRLSGLSNVVTIPGASEDIYHPGAYKNNVGPQGSYNLNFSSQLNFGGIAVGVPYSIDLGGGEPPPPPPPSGGPTYYSY